MVELREQLLFHLLIPKLAGFDVDAQGDTQIIEQSRGDAHEYECNIGDACPTGDDKGCGVHDWRQDSAACGCRRFSSRGKFGGITALAHQRHTHRAGEGDVGSHAAGDGADQTR